MRAPPQGAPAEDLWEWAYAILNDPATGIFSQDAERECPHGRQPHDPASTRITRRGICRCWDGFQMTKGQGEELRTEVITAIARLDAQHQETIDALKGLTNAIRDQTAALSRDIYAVNAQVQAVNGQR